MGGCWPRQRTIYYTAKTESLGKLLQPELVNSAPLPPTNYGLGIAYGNRFRPEAAYGWLLARGDYNILYSTDGTSWQAVTEGTSKFGAGEDDRGFGIANNHLLYGMDKEYYRPQ